MRVALCGIIKDEARDIAEWVLFHLLTEVDAVLVYDNGSRDGTRSVLERWSADHDIRVIDWPERPGQLTAYRHATITFGQEFDWIVFLDGDEFILCRRGAGRLRAHLEAADADAVALNWLCYGSSGVEDSFGRLVLSTFLNRGPKRMGTNRHVKSAVRPREVRGVVNAHFFDLRNPGRYRDLLGASPEWEKPGKMLEVPRSELIRVNHYITRSRAHFRAKLARGDVSNLKLLDTFDVLDRNDVNDPLAPKVYGRVLERIAALTGQSP